MHTLQELVYIHALINAGYPDIDCQIIATACTCTILLIQNHAIYRELNAS